MNDLGSAQRYVNKALELDPDNSGAIYRRGRIHLKRENFGSALLDFNRAAGDETNSWILTARAQANLGLGDSEQAWADWKKAEAVSPDNHYIYEARGRWLISQQRYEEALDDISKAIDLAPKRSFPYKRRAYTAFRLGRFHDSLADIRAALDLNPNDLSTLTWISPAEVARCSDEDLKAGLLQLATEAVEKNAAARSHRTLLALHLGRWDLARQDQAELTRAGRANYSDYYQLALLSLADKDDDQYRTACREMLIRFAESKKPVELDFALWTAALAPQALDDYRSVIALAEQAVELHQQHVDLRRSLSALLFRAGRYDEAVKQLAALVAEQEGKTPGASTSAAYPLFFFAMAQHQAGNEQDARTTLTKAVELTRAELSDQQTPPAWNRKLTLELLQDEASRMVGGQTDADEPSPRAIESPASPDTPTDAQLERALSRALARTLQDLGKLDAAVDAWQRVLKLDPSDADGWLQLARVQIDAGQLDQAARTLEQAFEQSPDEIRIWIGQIEYGLARGDAVRAVDWVLKVLQRLSSEPSSLPRQRILALLDRFDDAMLETLDPTARAKIFVSRAHYQARPGTPLQTDEQLAKLLDSKENVPELWIASARVYAERGEHEKADENFA